MLASYAVTLICTLLPSTLFLTCNEAPNPTSVQIELTDISQPHQHHPSIYYLPLEEEGAQDYFPQHNIYNVSTHFVAIHSGGSGKEVEDSVGVVVRDDEEQLLPADSADSPRVEEQEDLDYPLVQTLDGMLKGFTMKTITNRSIYAFKGIPFAQPPTGELRFEPPVKSSPWTGVRDAMADSPTCIQADYLQQYRVHGVEDCLYLSVFSPKVPSSRKDETELLPVMVWIHGGGWFFSTSSLYGPAYLLDKQVTLVSINYRLGSLGFLSTGDLVSPGNNGLKDQTLALRWVKDNIAAFGGDPNKITIFGESAGAGSVHLHMVSPLSRGLFHGAISQSGCATCFWSIAERAPQITRTYSKLLNCSGETSTQILACLKGKDAKELVFMQLALLEWTMYPVVIFGPVLEPPHAGSFLSEKPEEIYARGRAAPVPWISGVNKDEGAINIAVLFLGNGSLSQINSNWDKYGHIFLDFKDNEGSPENSIQLANKVRNHYLGQDKNITAENKEQVIKMFSDRYVTACGIKGIQLHARHSPSPVYAYRFSHPGKHSIVGLLGQKTSDWGVSHLDDLIYLFNNTDYYPTLSPSEGDGDDFAVSKIMTEMWVNFARTGRPYLSSSNDHHQLNQSTDLVWSPVRRDVMEIDFMDINLNPGMIKNPFEERVKFWRSLDLQDA